VNIQHLEYCTACYSLVAGMLNIHVWLLSRAPRGNPASPANMSVPKDETRFKVSSSPPKRFDDHPGCMAQHNVLEDTPCPAKIGKDRQKSPICMTDSRKRMASKGRTDSLSSLKIALEPPQNKKKSPFSTSCVSCICNVLA
jgi:hypothetical protein